MYGVCCESRQPLFFAITLDFQSKLAFKELPYDILQALFTATKFRNRKFGGKCKPFCGSIQASIFLVAKISISHELQTNSAYLQSEKKGKNIVHKPYLANISL